MKSKIFLMLASVATFFSLALVVNSLLSEQKGNLAKMKNGDTFAVKLDEAAIVKNIWKNRALEKWNIRIKVIAIDGEAARTQVSSSTFLGKDVNEVRFVKPGEFISIIQAEEIKTEVKLHKIVANSAIFSLKIQASPPAPELSENFTVEIE